MEGPLAPAFRLQTTIVHALMLREMASRGAKSRVGLIFAILDPLFGVATLFCIRYFLHGKVVMFGIPLAIFLASGYLPYFVFRQILRNTMNAAAAETPTMMFPQVTQLDAIIARILTTTLVNCAAMVVGFVFVIIAFHAEPPGDILKMILATLFLAWIGAILGLVIGAIAKFFPAILYVIGPVLRGGTYVTGPLFLAIELPQEWLRYVSWNPALHAIEMMREAWFPFYDSPVVDIGYLLKFCITGTVLALSLQRVAQQRTALT